MIKKSQTESIHIFNSIDKMERTDRLEIEHVEAKRKDNINDKCTNYYSMINANNKIHSWGIDMMNVKI